jgi:recombination protein RecA
MTQVLGADHVRRDRLARLAEALDSEFLRGVLGEDVWYDRIVSVSPPEWRDIYDLEVAEDHTLVASDIVAHNCSAPFRQAEFDIMYGKGISREGSLLDIGVDLGIVKKSGAWYTYEGEQLGQGRENAKAFLVENAEVMVEISERVRRETGIGDTDGDEAGADGEVDLRVVDTMTDANDEPITLDD